MAENGVKPIAENRRARHDYHLLEPRLEPLEQVVVVPRPAILRNRLDAVLGHADSLGAPSSNTCRLLARDHAAPESTLALAKAASLGRERARPLAWCSRPRNSAALLEGAGAPSSNTCRLLARDHAAPESTLALAKAASLGRQRVRPLAWCSRP